MTNKSREWILVRISDVQEYARSINERLGFEEHYDYVGCLHPASGLLGRLKILEEYLGITYVENCQEKLPKYIKKTDGSISPSSSKNKKSN